MFRGRLPSELREPGTDLVGHHDLFDEVLLDRHNIHYRALQVLRDVIDGTELEGH